MPCSCIIESKKSYLAFLAAVSMLSPVRCAIAGISSFFEKNSIFKLSAKFLQNSSSRSASSPRMPWFRCAAYIFALLFLAVLTGLFPIISAYISAQILNSLAIAYVNKNGLDTIIFWLILHPTNNNKFFLRAYLN